MQEIEFGINKWRTFGFIGIFLSIIAILFLIPLLNLDYYAHFALQCCFMLLILSVVCLVNTRKLYIIISVIMLSLILLFHALSMHHHSIFYLNIAYALSVAYILFAISILIVRVFFAPTINTNLLFGALTVYLLSAILWSKIYFIQNAMFPASFRGQNTIDFGITDFSKASELQSELLYYSFSIITTLGIGDIVPTHHMAKSLTVAEAMYGQLFIAIVIAKLVTIWKQQMDAKQQ